MNLQMQKRAAAASDRRQKERDNAVSSVASMLQKGHTTGLIFQNELNGKVKDAVTKLSDLAAAGAPAEEIRTFGASISQDLLSYGEAGTQVTELIDGMRKWNQANGKMIDEGVLMTDVTDKILLGENNKLRDARDITPEELSVENVVFGDKDGAGAKYLKKGEVISNLLKLPELKAAVVESRDFEAAEDLPAGKVGVIETRRKTKVPPFATVNQITGEVEILDAERLAQSPVFQVLMNHRGFATLVEDEVTRAYAPKDSPEGVFIPGAVGGTQEVYLPKKENASEDELNFMRAKAAAALLEGTQFNGAQVLEERRLKMQNRFQPRSSGKPSAATVKEEQQLAGYDRFQRDILSKDVGLMEDAVSWLDKKLGLSESSRSALAEAIGVKPEWELEGLTTDAPKTGSFAANVFGKLRSNVAIATGGLVASDATPKENIVYAKFKRGRSGYEYVPLDVTKLTGDRGIQYYLETSDKFMDYKAEKPGVDYDLPNRVAPQTTEEPIFVNPKIKK